MPVAIIGTFAAMAAMGFSLNNLSLFGLVLAIGIVVDDAIVVVEAVEHHIEQGMTPARPPIRPWMRFRPGHRHRPGAHVRVRPLRVHQRASAGQFFRQFALTIAISTILSALNSLTLSPALARRSAATARCARRPVFPGARTSCSAGSSSCSTGRSRCRSPAISEVVGRLLRVSVLVLLLYGGLLYLTVWSFGEDAAWASFPSRTRATCSSAIQLPDAASLKRTEEVAAMASKIARDTKRRRPRHQRHRLVLRCWAPTARNLGSMFIISIRSTSGAAAI